MMKEYIIRVGDPVSPRSGTSQEDGSEKLNMNNAEAADFRNEMMDSSRQ